MKNKQTLSQFIKFCIVGTFNTGLDFTILNLLYLVLHINIYVSNTASFFLSTTSAYLLNRYWSFRFESSESHLKKLLQYTIISAISLLLSNLFLFILTDKMHLYYNFSKLITVFILTPWNYFANRHWTFKTPKVDIQNKIS